MLPISSNTIAEGCKTNSRKLNDPMVKSKFSNNGSEKRLNPPDPFKQLSKVHLKKPRIPINKLATR